MDNFKNSNKMKTNHVFVNLFFNQALLTLYKGFVTLFIKNPSQFAEKDFLFLDRIMIYYH